MAKIVNDRKEEKKTVFQLKPQKSGNKIQPFTYRFILKLNQHIDIKYIQQTI